MTPTATQELARFAAALDCSDVPAPVRDPVGLHLPDVLGCGLAAVGIDAAPYAREVGTAAARAAA